MVPPDSVRISRAPTYSTIQMIRFAALGIPGFHSLWRGFPTTSARLANFLPYTDGGSICCQYRNPLKRISILVFVMSQPLLYIRLPTYPSSKLPDESIKSLGSSSFARHYSRNRCLLSLPRVTKMFQFTRLPLLNLFIQLSVTRHNSCRVSPFGYLRFKAC